MVCKSDEHMCKHLLQPLANYDHYYHSKNHTAQLCSAEGLYSRGFKLVPLWNFTIRPDGVSEHEQRFSKTEKDLTHFTSGPALLKSFWCYVKKQTQRCS